MKNPKSCFFFIPGLSEKYRTGGLLVIRDVADIFEKEFGYKVNFVAMHEKHPDAITPDEAFLIPYPSSRIPLFIVTWGPLVEQHIKLIQKNVPGARIIYYAQSFGWGIKVPPKIPVICVSRFVMAQCALYYPENFITYIPPPLNPCFKLLNTPRDIDILVHTRKQNEYCLKKLIPSLQAKTYSSTTLRADKLQVINSWIPQEQFAEFLNRTKIFLYITELHRANFFRRLPGEGFGLPALEAVACGAMVGSNLLGGVTDFLTPGENCIKLQNGDLNFDLKQIENTIENFSVNTERINAIISSYSRLAVAKKWKLFT